jgi:hydrogenase maturation protease
MIRVIGLGSPFGDDRVGWRVIELLGTLLPTQIDCVALDRPGAALINWMQGVDHLVLIDALKSGAPPGSIVTLTTEDLKTENPRLSGHMLALSDTLRLAETLGHLPARIDVYGIEMSGLTGQKLSESAAKAARKLSSRLVENNELND